MADKETTPADKKPTSPDTLVEGGKAELSEDELEGVAGGVQPIDYLKNGSSLIGVGSNVAMRAAAGRVSRRGGRRWP